MGELLAAAQIRRAEREALEAAQREQERARRERAAATAREQHLKKPSLLQRFDRARLTPAVAEREG